MWTGLTGSWRKELECQGAGGAESAESAESRLRLEHDNCFNCFGAPATPSAPSAWAVGLPEGTDGTQPRLIGQRSLRQLGQNALGARAIGRRDDAARVGREWRKVAPVMERCSGSDV